MHPSIRNKRHALGLALATLAFGCNQLIGLEEGSPASNESDAGRGGDSRIADVSAEMNTPSGDATGDLSDKGADAEDALLDGAPIDVRLDVGAETTPDASLDGSRDVAAEAEADATPYDATPDAALDASQDAAPDVRADTRSDIVLGDLLVTSVTPADNATGGNTDAVTLTFSHDVDPASVTASSVQVLVNGQPLTGTLSTSGSSVTFTPKRPLPLLIRHSVSVATTVHDPAGTPLKNAFSSSFTTRDGEWMITALKVENDDSAGAYGARIGIDGNGNAITVYQLNGSIWAQRWVATSQQWTNAVAIGIGSGPAMAVGENGNAVAVWHRNDGTRTNVWANYFLADTLDGQWKGAATIETSDVEAQISGVAIDSAGNAVASWTEAPGYPAPFAPCWNRYDATSSTWQSDGTCFALNDAGSATFQIGMDGLGNAFGMFVQADSVSWSRFADGGFTPPSEIVPAPAISPAHVVDRNGSAFLIWSTTTSVNARVFTPDGGWRSPSQLESTDAGPVGFFAMNGAGGRASAVWYRITGMPQVSSIYGTQCDTNRSGGCTLPTLVENDQRWNQQPTAAMDPNGNAIAVWSTNAAGQLENLFANRYVASTAAWGVPTLIESDNSWSASQLVTDAPRIAVGSDGRAIVVWEQRQPVGDAGDSRPDVWYNAFQ